MFEKITEAEINERSMANVSTTPNRPTAFGESKMDAQALKLRFDRLGRYLAGRINEIFAGISDGNLAKTVKIVEEKGEETIEYSLAEFILKMIEGDLTQINVKVPEGTQRLDVICNQVLRWQNEIKTGDFADETVVVQGVTIRQFYEEFKKLEETGQGKPGEPGKSAYDYAIEGGYQGTEEEFAKKLATEYPSKVSQLENDEKYITALGAPVQTVNGKAGNVSLSAADVGARPNTWMPSYSDVNADKAGTAQSLVSGHNTSTDSHNDIRLELQRLAGIIADVLDSDDVTLDEMHEIVAVIKANATIIEAITTGKVNVTDIIDNLTTNVKDKPLSAAQGVALKALIDALTTGKLDATELTSAINTALAQAKASGEFDGADGKTPYIQNGYWYIDGVNTNVKAQGAAGKDGANGETPLKGTDYWTPDDKEDILSEADSLIAEKIDDITSLPQGVSKAWLETHGDKTQAYQIDGYVWGYVESNGWVKGETPYLVVTNESQMTNQGGTAYLLRDGNEGTVYAYHSANDDAKLPSVSSEAELPQGVPDGTIYGVRDTMRKHEARNETKTKEHNAYDSQTASFNTRLNSAGDQKNLDGSLLLDYAEVTYDANCVVTIKGIEKLVKNYSVYVSIDYYKADKTRIGYLSGGVHYKPTQESTAIPNGYSGDLTLPLQFRLFAYNNTLDTSQTGFVRIKLGIKPDGTKISAADVEGLVVNFSTKNTTETTTYWDDIGEFAPVYEAWRATDETYTVVDSLPASPNHGYEAVLSGDGYVYTYLSGSDWVKGSKYDNPIDAIMINGKSAYKYAQDSGYTGTEAEFAKDINPDNIKSELSQIEAPKIVSSIAEMTDITKHYVLDRYIYQYDSATQTFVNSGLPYTSIIKADIVGVLGEGNVIYLSDNSLPSGTYTLKHSDETYAPIGTYTVE